jgi:hypothetical protein
MDIITIGFSRPKAWFEPFSWMIRLFLWTPYSHVYIRFHSVPYNSDLVFQASSLQVNFYSEAVFTSVEDVIQEFTIPVTLATKIAVIEFAMANVGKPYNIMGVFGVLLVWVASLVGKKIANPISGAGDFCSQLVGQILVEFLGDKLNYPVDVITPKDIFNYLSTTL